MSWGGIGLVATVPTMPPNKTNGHHVTPFGVVQVDVCTPSSQAAGAGSRTSPLDEWPSQPTTQRGRSVIGCLGPRYGIPCQPWGWRLLVCGVSPHACLLAAGGEAGIRTCRHRPPPSRIGIGWMDACVKMEVSAWLAQLRSPRAGG